MRIRPVIVLSALAAAGLVLAGCSGSATPTPSETPTVSADLCDVAAAPGEASDSITVKGEFGKEPTVDFTAPLEIASIERTVITEGDGDAITEGQLVDYAITTFDAESGDALGAQGYTSNKPLPQQVTAAGAGQFFGCATIGSRFVLAVPAAEGGQALVHVVDVLGVSPAAAWGEPQEPVDGMPEVTLADDGTPTVTIPDTDAPTELEIAVLKQGDGEKVKDGDYVLTQYTGVSWDTKENFDSSWSRGAPAPFATNQVYEGFGKALVGQKVGSQVLVVMPPSMGDLSGDLKGQTLVFVIDILGTQHADS
ncbi:MAG: FKBP-type peptidyl-prolyl cis-trans isomerase [Microbacterium sp.]|uniref:FKBP-type peptidyl-prolyl cis-trans isomerase n=1 Tax=Microbacterium sp. TaxID=51671 RepID=UPI0039E4B95F